MSVDTQDAVIVWGERERVTAPPCDALPCDVIRLGGRLLRVARDENGRVRYLMGAATPVTPSSATP